MKFGTYWAICCELRGRNLEWGKRGLWEVEDVEFTYSFYAIDINT